MNRVRHMPPWPATAMLRLIADREKREAIAGDLIEEFQTGERSNLWYWRQVMQTVGHTGGKAAGALLAGIAIVAAVLVIVTASMQVLLPMVANHSQPIHFVFTFAVLALVLAGTAVAGYLTARMVGHAETRTSMLLGAVVLLTGFWWLRIGAPAWFIGLQILLTIPAAWVGGYIRVQQKARA